jgi:hypothetical protein
MFKPILFTTALFASSCFAFTNTAGTNDISAKLSVAGGGLAFGFDYEHLMQTNLGVGGYFHYYAKDDSSTHPEEGAIAFGTQATAHYTAGPWDAYLAPGFGFVNVMKVAANTKDVFTAGPKMAFGLLYVFNSQFAVGMEENAYYGWFNSDARGEILNDLALKGRLTF